MSNYLNNLCYDIIGIIISYLDLKELNSIMFNNLHYRDTLNWNTIILYRFDINIKNKSNRSNYYTYLRLLNIEIWQTEDNLLSNYKTSEIYNKLCLGITTKLLEGTFISNHYTIITDKFDIRISNLVNLLKLDICGIELIDIKFISCLTKLQQLGLWDNKLENIEFDGTYLTKLNYIRISFNKIKTIPQSIRNLKGLKRLYISLHNIKELEVCEDDFPVLEILEIRNGKLKHFPKGLYNIRNLKELDLEYNNIEEICYIELFLLCTINLIYLDIGHNRITELPSEIINLTKLKTIRITQKYTISLPDEIFIMYGKGLQRK